MQQCLVLNEEYVLFLLISLVNAFLSQPLPTSPYIIPSHTLSESMLRSQDTEIREIAKPLPLCFHSFLSLYTAAPLMVDIVLTVLTVNRMWRREVLTTVGESVRKMPLFFKHMKKKIINLDFEVISENTVLFLLHSKLYPKPIHFTVTKQIIIRTQSLTSSIFFCISFS